MRQAISFPLIVLSLLKGWRGWVNTQSPLTLDMSERWKTACSMEKESCIFPMEANMRELGRKEYPNRSFSAPNVNNISNLCQQPHILYLTKYQIQQVGNILKNDSTSTLYNAKIIVILIRMQTKSVVIQSGC